MSSMHYFAAWTECGCLLGCSHEHETIVEADSCIPCSGGYVVAVEDGVMRSLTGGEESEFQRAHYAHRTDKSAVWPAAPPEAAVRGPGYSVMIRIRVGHRWTWTTWMRFETYAEAAAHVREGNKVVRFRSPEWAALRQHSETVSPNVTKTRRESIPPQGEGETFLEFVLRFLTTYDFDQHAKRISDAKHGLIDTDMIDLFLSRLSESETSELEKMYAEDKHALMEALGKGFRTVLKPKSECD